MQESKGDKFLFIDVEATDKLWYNADLQLIGYKFEDEEPKFVSPKDSAAVEEFRALYSSYPLLSGHNFKYDALVLKKHGFNFNPKCYISDTVLISNLLDNRGSHRLVDLCIQAKLVDGGTKFEEIIGKGKDKIDNKDIPYDTLIKKCSQDLTYTELLHKHYKSLQGIENHVWKLYDMIEEPFLKRLIITEWTGVEVDLAKASNITSKYENELKGNEAFLQSHYPGVNFKSSSQVAKLLFPDGKGIKMTEKNNISVDDEVLKELSLSSDLPKIILESRKINKILRTYIHGVLKYVANGRVHPQFIQFKSGAGGTSTGRLSACKPNIQNIPEHSRAREVKSIFVADQGTSFVSLDLSQIELRLLAHQSQDPILLEAYKKDLDLHSITGQDLFEKEHLTYLERYIGKTFNFALGFGAWTDTLMSTLKKGLSIEEYSKISREQIERLIYRYWNKYKRLKEWIDETKANVKGNGYSETITGRRRYFDDPDGFLAQREGVNATIQGSAADIAKKLAIRLSKFENAVPVNYVHDSITSKVESKDLNEVAMFAFRIKQEVIKTGKDFNLTVPLRAKVKIGNSFMDV